MLTLNTMVRAEGPVLCTYLHEQMLWYATWYSYANHSGWRAIWQAIIQMFPSVPIQVGAHTETSSYLRIIVNWLDIDAAAALLGRDAATEMASKNFVYSGIFALVLREWEPLAELYQKHGLVPIRPGHSVVERGFAPCGTAGGGDGNLRIGLLPAQGGHLRTGDCPPKRPKPRWSVRLLADITNRTDDRQDFCARKLLGAGIAASPGVEFTDAGAAASCDTAIAAAVPTWRTRHGGCFKSMAILDQFDQKPAVCSWL